MKCCVIIFLLCVIFQATPLYASGRSESRAYTLEQATTEAMRRISLRINSGSLAVINILSSNANTSLQITRWLETGLSQRGKFEIVTRQQINMVMAEQNFGMSGYVDDNSAQRIGYFLGTQYILLGELINVENENILNIQVLEVETARIIFSENFRIKNRFRQRRF